MRNTITDVHSSLILIHLGDVQSVCVCCSQGLDSCYLLFSLLSIQEKKKKKNQIKRNEPFELLDFIVFRFYSGLVHILLLFVVFLLFFGQTLLSLEAIFEYTLHKNPTHSFRLAKRFVQDVM